MTERDKLLEVFVETVNGNHGRYLTKKEFLERVGFSESDLFRLGFSSYTELCDSVEQPMRPQNQPVSREEILTDWGRVARRVGRVPSVPQYRTHGKHSHNHLYKMGPYPEMAARSFIEAYEDDPSWADVVGIIRKARAGGSRPTAPPKALEPKAPVRVESVAHDPELPSLDRFGGRAREAIDLMRACYAALYCLERQMRQIVTDTLLERVGVDWWIKAVPVEIQDNAKRNRQREEDSGVTLRSSALVDYTTLGELGTIVDKNWSHFGNVFQNQSALRRHMGSLNTLRAYIAHCTPLPPDEVVRLKLAVSDWFRNLKS